MALGSIFGGFGGQVGGQVGAKLAPKSEEMGYQDDVKKSSKIWSRSGTQVIGSQESGLMVEEEGAARSLEWRDIDPRSLLGLHRVLIDETDKDSERARLLVNALSFGWLNGLTGECRMMAEELVKLRPDFAVQWEKILEDFGK